jgi:hypothetical protein
MRQIPNRGWNSTLRTKWGEKNCLLDPLFIIRNPMYNFHPDFSFHHQARQKLGHIWGTHNSIVCKLVEKSTPSPLNPEFGTWNFYTCLVVGVQASYLSGKSVLQWKTEEESANGGFCEHCNKFGGSWSIRQVKSHESWIIALVVWVLLWPSHPTHPTIGV